MSDTYLVVVHIRDGDNSYYLKEMVEVCASNPTDDDFIKNLYGDITYDDYEECWDLSCGQGYPLVRIAGFSLVEEDHIKVLRSYGI